MNCIKMHLVYSPRNSCGSSVAYDFEHEKSASVIHYIAAMTLSLILAGCARVADTANEKSSPEQPSSESPPEKTSNETSSPLRYKWRLSETKRYLVITRIETDKALIEVTGVASFTPRPIKRGEADDFIDSSPVNPVILICESESFSSLDWNKVEESRLLLAIDERGIFSIENAPLTKNSLIVNWIETIEPLPKGTESEWMFERTRGFGIEGAMKSSDCTKFRIGERSGNRIRVYKTSKITPYNPDENARGKEGSGSFVFDIERGEIIESEMQLEGMRLKEGQLVPFKISTKSIAEKSIDRSADSHETPTPIRFKWRHGEKQRYRVTDLIESPYKNKRTENSFDFSYTTRELADFEAEQFSGRLPADAVIVESPGEALVAAAENGEIFFKKGMILEDNTDRLTAFFHPFPGSIEQEWTSSRIRHFKLNAQQKHPFPIIETTRYRLGERSEKIQVLHSSFHSVDRPGDGVTVTREGEHRFDLEHGRFQSMTLDAVFRLVSGETERVTRHRRTIDFVGSGEGENTSTAE